MPIYIARLVSLADLVKTHIDHMARKIPRFHNTLRNVHVGSTLAHKVNQILHMMNLRYEAREHDTIEFATTNVLGLDMQSHNWIC